VSENGIARLEHEAGLPELRQCAELLARVQSLPEAKDLIAAADALRTFMRKADLGYANQNAAANIAIKARRKAGEIARQIERELGGRPMKTCQPGLASSTDLQNAAEELGVNRETLRQWQTLAATTSEEDIDQAAARATEEKRELTTADLLPRTKSPEWIAKLRSIEADVMTPGAATPVILKDFLRQLRELPEPEEVARTLPQRIRAVTELETPSAIVDWIERYERSLREESTP
jgi:hypothetical protein